MNVLVYLVTGQTRTFTDVTQAEFDGWCATKIVRQGNHVIPFTAIGFMEEAVQR